MEGWKIEEKKKPTFLDFVATHILLIIFILGSFGLWLIVNIFWPRFFDPFKYWYLIDNIPLSVIQIAPLLIYALILALIRTKKIKAKEITLIRDIYCSVMAGILEEIGYRCLFIFTAMIPIAIIDFLLFGVATLIYKVIMFPIVNFLTLGLMSGVIYGLPPLLIAGAISANATFRDGHKYQGAFGYINSWFVGMYMLGIMFTQGLVIAILVHMIYDLIIDFVRYWARSTKEQAASRKSMRFFI